MIGARLEAGTPQHIHAALTEVPAPHRGFAYEGAAMSAALIDLLSPNHSSRLAALRAASGWAYRHLIHVGVGWAMARLHLRRPPRRLQLDPLLQWLALDGVGFHRMFFTDTEAARRQALQTAPVSETQYVVTQGLGRALWFTTGADLDAITHEVGAAAGAARPALWSGIGLAAAYAGGPSIDPDRLVAAAGDHSPRLRQGVVFGLAARQAHDCLDGSPLSALAPTDPLQVCDSHAARRTTAGGGIAEYRGWQHDIERLEVGK